MPFEYLDNSMWFSIFTPALSSVNGRREKGECSYRPVTQRPASPPQQSLGWECVGQSCGSLERIGLGLFDVSGPVWGEITPSSSCGLLASCWH